MMASNSDYEVGVLQTTVLEYRLRLYELLREELGQQLKVVCGCFSTNDAQQTPEQVWEYARRVENIFFLKGRLLWQRGAVSELVDCNIVIVDANMRNISTVCLVVLRRLRGRKTIAWGHAEGRSRIGGFFRKYYYKCFDGIIAYTESQREVISNVCAPLPVWSAFNACLSSSDCYSEPVSLEELTDFICVGRLVPRKKPDLLVRAFKHARDYNMVPPEARLIVVGTGAMKNDLEFYCRMNGLSSHVIFTGAIYETGELRRLYRKAICAVNPGYAGLSVTQACGFGVPNLVAKGEPHSPEIEVCVDGQNAVYFDSNDAVSLANCLSQFYADRARWLNKRKDLSDETGQRYSFEKMASTFLEVYSSFKKSQY